MKLVQIFFLIFFTNYLSAGIGQDQMSQPGDTSIFDIFDSPNKQDNSSNKSENLKASSKSYEIVNIYPDLTKINYINEVNQNKRTVYSVYYNNEDTQTRGYNKDSKLLSVFNLEASHKVNDEYLIPTSFVHLKKNEFQGLFVWNMINCNKKTHKNLGLADSVGKFTINPPENVHDVSTWAGLQNVVCGFDLEGKKYFQYASTWNGQEDNNEFWPLAWTAQSNFIDGDLRNIESISPIRGTRKATSFSGYSRSDKAQVDCLKKTVTLLPSTTMPINETNGFQYLLLHKQLCEPESIFYKANIFINDKKTEITEKINIEENKKLDNKEKAKETCIELGFKNGTEEYLNCVLELL